MDNINKNKLREFLFPVILMKKEFLWLMAIWVFFALFNFIDIEIIRRITQSLENWDYSTFYYIIAIALVSKSLGLFLVYIVKKTGRPILAKIRQNIYAKYMKKFITMNSNQASQLWTWRTISIIESWYLTRANLLYDLFAVGMRRTLSIIVWLWYLVRYWWKVLWIGIILIIVLIVIWLLIIKKEKIARTNSKEVSIRITKLTVKQIMWKFEILQAAKKDTEISKMNLLHNELIEKRQKEVPYKFINQWVLPFIIDSCEIIWLFLIGIWILNKSLTIADLITFVAIYSLIKSMTNWIIDQLKEFSNQVVNVEKLRDTFDAQRPIYGYNSGQKFIFKKWDIVIKNLTYGYDTWKKIFKDFNIAIKGWKKTALVGHSWSWKSTLAKLIWGYLTTKKWTISIDNQILPQDKKWQRYKTVSLKSYFYHIGYLTQEASVFDWSILENLTYWIQSEPSKQELSDAIKNSVCEFIYDLPQWLETQIWEKGIKLSGWQRQRLAIAKIFLKNPEIIILDEPTSALDSVSEEQVTKAMHNLFAWRTVIIIAHRLQTVKDADDIIVMENWQIIERWNHKTLKNKNWHYSTLVELQSAF